MNDNDNFSWKTLMQPVREDQPKMKAPALVGIVVTLHVLAVGAFLFIQGCGTVQPGTRTAKVEPPPPPVMPPRVAPTPSPAMPRPGLKPPAPVQAPRPMADATTHIVKSGESLSKIAAQYGVSTRELAAFNQISNPNSLRVNQKILIPSGGAAPVRSAAAASAPSPAAAKPAIDLSKAEQVYVVQSGDSLSRIAAKYGTTVSALREANGLTGDRIRVGDKLAIPSGSKKPAATDAAATAVAAVPEVSTQPAPPPVTVRPATAAPAASAPSVPATTVATTPVESADPAGDAIASIGGKPITYTVLEGDTLDTISKLFIVSKQDIIQLNNLAPDAVLEKGQKIRIPPSAL